jgi:hypothetical protein
MTVISRAGQALGGYAPPLGARAGLQDMEQRESNRLLKMRAAFDLHVG